MYVVITGASKGIGFELLTIALNQGHHVLAVARNTQSSKDLMSLKEKHGSLEILDLDLNDPLAHSKIKEAIRSWPCVDAVINNAGIYRNDDSIEDFEKTFLVNSIKPFFITKALLPELKKSHRPVSLQISSQMGSIEDNNSGGSASYRASKAALNMIFKGLSIEEKWLVVLQLHPGWVQTQMGGNNAPLTPQESARGIWKILEECKLKESGRFLNYLGEKLPW